MSTKQPSARHSVAAVFGKILIAVGFTAVVILLLMWLAGSFSPKIDATHATPAVAAGRPVGNTPLVAARIEQIPRVEPAVGTVRAVRETGVASKILAKVLEVNIQAGQTVRENEVLVRLDDEDLKARVQQAEAAVASADAALAQAKIEFERVDRLRQQNNATQIEWERTGTAVKTSQAELERSKQALREAETNLSYATVRSPFDATVIDKQVDVGDTVSPGQVLLTLYDPEHMQLIARVRESLAHRLHVGQPIGVSVAALEKVCTGEISEIVPEAESSSRSFSVKVTGPCPPGVYTGMFGRLLVPLDAESVLLIPQAAIRTVGQLTLVDVAESSADGKEILRRRAVRLGREFDDNVEVLAGLEPGERVALHPAADSQPGAGE